MSRSGPSLPILRKANAPRPGSKGHAQDSSPLQLETKIALGQGRIDHIAVDLTRQRLFVAELGNDSVGIIDLRTEKLARRITGLEKSQGVGQVSSSDMLFVANAGDGSIRLFQDRSFRSRAFATPLKQLSRRRANRSVSGNGKGRVRSQKNLQTPELMPRLISATRALLGSHSFALIGKVCGKFMTYPISTRRRASDKP